MHIRPVGDSTFFGAIPEVDSTAVDSTEVFSVSKGVYRLVIPDTATLDTLIKKEIGYKVKKDTNTHNIDPYLILPNQR